MKLLIGVSFVLSIGMALMSCSDIEKEELPLKPSDVPQDAVWVGGLDGGVWIYCVESSRSEFVCKLYSANDGFLLSDGSYVIKSFTWTEKKLEIADPEFTEITSFKLYDGTRIYLNDNHALFPDGSVDYYFYVGGGKKVVYKLGEVVTETQWND